VYDLVMPVEDMVEMTRPRTVRIFVLLNIVSLILEQANNLFYREFFASMGRPFNLGRTLFELALLILFIVLILDRRNWARMTYAVFMGGGLILYFINVVRMFNYSYTLGFLNLLNLGLGVVAILCLFEKKTIEWFRRKTQA